MPIILAAHNSILLQEAVTDTMPASTPLQSKCTLYWYNICLSWMACSSLKTFYHWFTNPVSRPELAAEIMVFITIWFGAMSSLDILIFAPAFIKSEVIKMMSVPAIRKLTLLAKKVLLQFCLYILKISIIYLFVRFLNYGNSLLNRFILLILILCCLIRLRWMSFWFPSESSLFSWYCCLSLAVVVRCWLLFLLNLLLVALFCVVFVLLFSFALP